MNSKALTVAKINLRNNKRACWITLIIMGCLIVQDIVYVILGTFGLYPGASSIPLGIGNYLFLLVILSAVNIPSQNFRKMMNLGGKRADFFAGAAIAHVALITAVSLAAVILYYTYERFIGQYYMDGTLNVLYWFGWIENGPAVAFFQQFAFLLLVAAAIHTLAAAQERWYGWAADALIVAVVAVFTPIAPLRAALLRFFNLIIFHSNAFLQIIACLILAAAVYSLNKPIFARKVI